MPRAPKTPSKVQVERQIKEMSDATLADAIEAQELMVGIFRAGASFRGGGGTQLWSKKRLAMQDKWLQFMLAEQRRRRVTAQPTSSSTPPVAQ